MNIFKILANGDGSISEPNVSAFLGYLLDPKADHGIGDEFLKRVLFRLYSENKKSSLHDFLVDKLGVIRKLGFYSNFHFEVLLEQAFNSKDGKKQIVDIVLLCYEKRLKARESLAQILIRENKHGELRQIFLIENKINKATREQQLIDQYEFSIHTLKEILKKKKSELEKMISIIFISPNEEKANKEFASTQKKIPVNIPKMHIHWNNNPTDDEDMANTATDFLKDILEMEGGGEIDSINDYTKATIKSFVTFIENGFKSLIEEKLEGETIRDIGYEFTGFQEKYPKLLNEGGWATTAAFQAAIHNDYKNRVVVRHSPTHPVSVLVLDDNKEKKIFSLTRSGASVKAQLVFRQFPIDKYQIKGLIAKLETIPGVRIDEKDRTLEIRKTNLTVEDAKKLFSLQFEWFTEHYSL